MRSLEDFLNTMQGSGSVEGLRVQQNDDGEIEMTFEMDEEISDEYERRVRALVEMGLVEEVSEQDSSSSEQYSSEGSDSESDC